MGQQREWLILVSEFSYMMDHKPLPFDSVIDWSYRDITKYHEFALRFGASSVINWFLSSFPHSVLC